MIIIIAILLLFYWMFLTGRTKNIVNIINFLYLLFCCQQVRLSALEVVCTFTTYLGDNFLPFLPETVPFLAELLEDENENVEKQTHKAVQRLEQILEEPIQKYF